jgi:predicted DNA-binding transcriptional regulator YafY
MSAQAWLANDRVKAVRLPDEPLDNDMSSDWEHFLLHIESIEHGMRQLLGFGAEVKVLEPPTLKAALQQELERLNTIYQVACNSLSNS